MLVAVNDDELRRLSDERDRLKQGYAALESENAKLRERIDATHMSRLLTENENESLRELAAKMAEALRVGGEWCDRECIVVFGCDGMDECPIAKELRELGVEVDG